MFDNYISVKEAASRAGVTIKSIYYHVNKSKKLDYRVVIGHQIQVSRESLDRLYYHVPAGKKQHVAKVRPLSDLDKIKIQESIAYLRANGFTVLTEA